MGTREGIERINRTVVPIVFASCVMASLLGCEGVLPDSDSLPSSPDCTETCGGTETFCGEVCGEVCGECESSEQCINGRCECGRIKAWRDHCRSKLSVDGNNAEFL